jgi:hypothetical protein
MGQIAIYGTNSYIWDKFPPRFVLVALLASLPIAQQMQRKYEKLNRKQEKCTCKIHRIA